MPSSDSKSLFMEAKQIICVMPVFEILKTNHGHIYPLKGTNRTKALESLEMMCKSGIVAHMSVNKTRSSLSHALDAETQ